MRIHPPVDASAPFPTPCVDPLDMKGVVYVATGRCFLEEARASATHLRRHHPHLPICLISDCAENDPTPFWDDLVPVRNPAFGFRDKILMGVCPYRRFLFLDADTRIIEPIDEIFGVLERFDFVGHQLFEGHDCPIPGVPDLFPEFNSGVIGFCRSEAIKGFFESWQKNYDHFHALNTGGAYHYANVSDQKSLRLTIWQSTLTVAVLGPEYNFTPQHLSFACASVRILHGRGDEHLDNFGRRLNAKLGNRIYIPRLDVVVANDPLPAELLHLWLMSGLQLLRITGRALIPLALRDLLRHSRLINRLFMRNRFTESAPNDSAKWEKPASP